MAQTFEIMQFHLPFADKWSKKNPKPTPEILSKSKSTEVFLLETADEQLKTLGPIALWIGTVILVLVNVRRIIDGDWAGFVISIIALSVGWFVVKAQFISAHFRIALFMAICYMAGVTNFISHGLIDNGRIVLFYTCIGSVALMRRRYRAGMLMLCVLTIFATGLLLRGGFLEPTLVIEHPELTFDEVLSLTLYFGIFAGVSQFLIITIYQRLLMAWKKQITIEEELREQNRLMSSLASQRAVELKELQLSQQELARYKNRLEGMVEQRTQELHIERDRANQANNAKSNFVARMSHELRTPLNAILGYSQLLREELEEEAEAAIDDVKNDLQRIERSGTHLLQLINDVLDLSKIEASKMEIDFAEHKISDLIEEVEINTRPLSGYNRNNFIIKNHIPEAQMQIDGGRFKQILINLVGNALKFTTDGEVNLDINQQVLRGEDWIKIEVKDTGIGMQDEFLEHIFEPFVQEFDSLTRKQGGSGLGLAISQNLALLMGGELKVESKFGVGTTFTLVLPKKCGLNPNQAFEI